MIGVYLRTARYYRPSQIVARLRFGLERAVRKRLPQLGLSRYSVPLDQVRNEQFVFFPPDGNGCKLWREAENASRLQRGIFRFLNSEKSLGFPVDWNPTGTTRLWRYNLHYFDYALDLALLARHESNASCADLMERLFMQWIEANRIGEGIGWHSYPIARRIVNWVQACTLATPETVFKGRSTEMAWISSLYQQARYLEDHLEVDVLGNHLLANGKALVFAGLFFGGKTGSRWVEIGQRILQEGLQDQILNDGGHEERSPMYHAIVLQDYLEVLLAYQLNEIPVPDWVRDQLIRMADFLDAIRHPDGEIPLFGDSAFGIAHAATDILATAERLLNAPGRWGDARPGNYCALLAPADVGSSPILSAPHQPLPTFCATGYSKLTGSRKGDAMIIDTKPLGPPHLPAHGHCSLFSYELSICRERIVVDSGVEEYEPGMWRSFWRSTRAHNTVVVDGAEQSEIWGSFRAGQRVQLLQSNCAHARNSGIFMGTHGGFAGQREPTPHRRIVAALPGGLWIVFDKVSGNGSHAVESLVHLAPKAECAITESFASVSLNNIELRIYPYLDIAGNSARMTSVSGSTNPIQGWYASEFGNREANTVIVFSCDANLPAQLGYLIAPADFPVISWDIQVNSSPHRHQVEIVIRDTQEDHRHRFNIPG